MCKGYFKENRPTINTFLLSPNFSKISNIEFIIDTGADGSAITLADALKLGTDIISVVSPNRHGTTEGVGGPTDKYSIEDIGFVFLDYSPSTNKISFHIEYLEKIDLIPKLPLSILGRDLLDRFDIEISKVSEEINLKRNDFGKGGHICFSL